MLRIFQLSSSNVCRLGLSLLLAIALVGIQAIPAFAIQGNAAIFAQGTDEIELPITPSPEDCTITPIDAEATIELISELEVDGQLLVPEAPTIPEDGEAPDDETLHAITETLVMFAACANAENYSRYLATFTPAGLITLFSEALGSMIRSGPTPDLTVEDISDIMTFLMLATGESSTPVSDDEVSGLESIDEAIVLDDGRVYVELTGTTGTGDSLITDNVRMVFIESDDGTYLIDYFYPMTDDEETDPA